MTDKASLPHLYNLLAFLAVLGAIVALALNHTNSTDLAIMTGLVGVLGSFKPWSLTTPSGPAGTKEDPLAVAGSDGTPVVTKDETDA